jgi:hypothetical protein
VGAAARGTSDLLEPDCGLVHEVGDVDGLVSAIKRLLQDPQLAATIRTNARARIQNYDVRALVEWHVCAYHALAASRPEDVPSAPEWNTSVAIASTSVLLACAPKQKFSKT